MRDPPSGRVPEQGPDWFLVGTEACGGGTPDLGFCIYRNFWFRSHVKEVPEASMRQAHAPGGVGTPPTLVGSPGLFWPASGIPWASSGRKMISVKWHVNWTPFSFPFLRYSKTRRKQKLALGSRLIG